MEGAGSEGSQLQSSSWGPPVFPSGLRVLVVDDDPTCLKIVGGMLRKCNYEGAPCFPPPALLRQRAFWDIAPSCREHIACGQHLP